MRFQPKTENEIAEAGLWPAAEYDFEVAEADDAVSKTGNEMVHLRVRVFNTDGAYRTVDDYLVSTEKAAFKIRHFAAATGMLATYERGEISAEEMVGRVGRCKLIVKKDENGQYPDKNSISDYLKPKDAVAAPAQAQRQKAPAGDLDDEIPF